MQYRRIGNTDLEVSTIGFGTWEMSTNYGEIDVDEASDAVAQAIDHGITLFDTAEVYGPYHSEELLAKALGPRRNKITLVTKVGFDYTEESSVIGRNSKREHIAERTEGSLRRLNTDVIDLLLIHWPDHDTPFEETMRGLEDLVAAGKVRYYGVSNFTTEMMEECNRHGSLATNQVGYHMFDRRMEAEVLPWCLANETGFMAYGSLGFGLLSGAFTPETSFPGRDWRANGTAFGLPLFEEESFAKELIVGERLKSIAAEQDKSLPQLAIAWVLDNPAVSVALVGMRNEHELQENVAAADWRLTDEIRVEIDRVFEEEGVPTYSDAPQEI